jgi:hypothetical protein
MGSSEVSMKEGDNVELLKVGCAGWWFVKVLGNAQLYFFVFFFFLRSKMKMVRRILKILFRNF